MKRVRNLNREQGFTLIELLVVVVVIGVLIAIAIPVYLHFKEGAYDASAKADLDTLRLEEHNYAASNSGFGTTNQLIAANPKLTMSSGTVAAVVWSSANAFCAAVANVHGVHDDAAPLAGAGFPFRTWAYNSDTGTIAVWNASTNPCPQPQDAQGMDGYLDNSTG